MAFNVSSEMETTLKALKRNGFEAIYAQNAAEAKELMLQMIPPSASIGISDSTTVRQIGIIPELIKRGNKVINPYRPELSTGIQNDLSKRKVFSQEQRRTFFNDFFMAGSNALTLDCRNTRIFEVFTHLHRTLPKNLPEFGALGDLFHHFNRSSPVSEGFIT